MIKDGKKIIFVDMRSPKEFYEYRIPGSINLPILEDDEREVVGRTYVKEKIKLVRCANFL